MTVMEFKLFITVRRFARYLTAARVCLADVVRKAVWSKDGVEYPLLDKYKNHKLLKAFFKL